MSLGNYRFRGNLLNGRPLIPKPPPMPILYYFFIYRELNTPQAVLCILTTSLFGTRHRDTRPLSTPLMKEVHARIGQHEGGGWETAEVR